MSFFLKWLGLERSGSKIGLRPHRDVTLAMPYDDAYSKTLEALDLVLGASVRIDDRKTGTIEAGFGLINTERLRVTLEPNADDLETTDVRIEALFAAGAEIPETSRYVDALAVALTAS